MKKNFLLNIFELKRVTKTTIQISTDVILVATCFFLSLILRLNDFGVIYIYDNWLILAFVLPLTIIIFIYFGFYQSIIRYVSEKYFLTAIIAVFLSSIIIFLISKFFNFFMPRSIPFIYFSLLFFFIVSIRYFLKYLFLSYNFDQRKNVAIYGAGITGRNLFGYLNESLHYKPLIFLDDNKKIINKKINGMRVYEFQNSIDKLKKLKIETILLAMPNIPQTSKQKIINKLVKENFNVKTIAKTNQIINENKKITNFSNITISDILDREEIPSISYLTKKNIKNKVVIITGAGGSIGSELCEQVLDNNPKMLICVDNAEYSLYCLEKTLKTFSSKNKLNIKIIYTLGSIQDTFFLKNIFKNFKIDTIYHTAAYKHVPILEENIVEGVKNNIFGTLAISELAVLNKVKTFILISSDKAVRPTNYMGATKRMAELICQSFSKKQTHTIFSTVRFGNVIGSSGSVIPLFENQIKNGGPITVTHKDVTRYFMTIKEAVDLVIQAGAMSKNGDLFILEMGKPIKILKLAEKLIRLYGKEPMMNEIKIDKNLNLNYIKIKITGLRPGEKIYEELLIDNKTFPTKHPRILRATEKSIDNIQLENIVANLKKNLNNFNVEKIESILLNAPIDFKSSKKLH